jgi:HlyD family secretion protein
MHMLRLLKDRRILLSVLVVGSLVGVGLWPRAVSVDVARVTRGPLVVTIDEEGRTRVRERFVVAAPVSGRLLRIELDPGDLVERGTIVARLQPELPTLLDARSRAEAVAAVQSAEASLEHARAEERRAHAAVTQTQRELSRSRDLLAAGVTTRQELDVREAEASLAVEARNAAASAVRAASAEVERARARAAAPASQAANSGAVVVRAPVGGVVLQRLRESESVVRAGEPLVEIGDPRRIEIVTDLLSTDAVRVKPGARAVIDEWGGDASLAAIVRRVEPAGFTKISALGVEEQRVNVVLDLADSGEDEDGGLLGDAYRVEARIVLWEASDVLRMPTNALFRQAGRWAVYAVSDGRARLTFVELGQQTGTEAQITGGLTEGALVISHPGDLVHDGTRIATRPQR